MAREIPVLEATERTGTGKGAARQARREGNVPGVVYGGGKAPIAINMNYNYLRKRLDAGRFLQTLFSLEVKGHPPAHVICREVQRDVVKDLPTHVDFVRISDRSHVKLFIHVNFINADEAPGLKRDGGTLTVIRHEVELDVLASNIPDHIVVDLAGLEIGDIVHIGDVTLPEGTRPTIERNFAIANIAPPSVLIVADDEEAAEAEEGAEAATPDAEATPDEDSPEA